MTRTVLFLQLPLLDNDTSGAHENVLLAGQYLARAIDTGGEGRWHAPAFLPPEADGLGDGALAEAILRGAPDVIAATLYLWNVERTLGVLREVRRRRPDVKLVAGGPEAAPDHPFLFARRLFDAVVTGEGEAVFAPLLRHWRGAGPRPDFATVAWRDGRGYAHGTTPPPAVDLAAALPPPAAAARQPGRGGVAYMETTRGCPLRCAYCRYHHLHGGVHALDARAVVRRVEQLAAAGFREVRFIDPTFNANPAFDRILDGLAALNRDGRLAFYAEIQADRITARQADRLARARFTELEAGVQSIDPAVLRAIRRPCRPAALEQGLAALDGAGIRVTIDVMYGLPRQTARDVWASVAWASRFQRARVQCMQTLLLPGTDLRAEAQRWGLRAGRRPPYGVASTPWIGRNAMADLERRIQADRRLPGDPQTARFVGRRLPGLFTEPAGARANRRVLALDGDDLFARREELCACIRAAVRREPHALWQFVLAPRREEPLDLLDRLVAAIRACPPLVTDRWAGAALTGRRAARRLLVRLAPGRRWDAGWIDAAEDLLRRAFC